MESVTVSARPLVAGPALYRGAQEEGQGSALVFLPFPRASFKQTSVGYGWDKQFDAALDGVEVVELANEMPPKNKQPDAYVDCNRQISMQRYRRRSSSTRNRY